MKYKYHNPEKSIAVSINLCNLFSFCLTGSATCSFCTNRKECKPKENPKKMWENDKSKIIISLVKLRALIRYTPKLPSKLPSCHQVNSRVTKQGYRNRRV